MPFSESSTGPNDWPRFARTIMSIIPPSRGRRLFIVLLSDLDQLPFSVFCILLPLLIPNVKFLEIPLSL